MSKKLSDMNWNIEKSGFFIQTDTGNLDTMRDLLNSTGCGMCLAKFRQVTMHLGTGMTHACHHPRPHKIPLKEIKANPAALFNTNVLKQARKEMLNGERPSECDYCWRVEDSGGRSDRIYKSIENWARPDHDEVIQLTGDEDIYPAYLEVSFSNACNFSCTYCAPEFSSVWVEKLKLHGPLKVLQGTDHEQWLSGYQNLDSLSYAKREFNPYLDAFWKWWPEAYKHLKNFRITGGEPLMSKDTFMVMEWLIENPNPELDFAINSNLGVPDSLWNKFVYLLIKLRDSGAVKRLTIFTSVEGWGERAEYARPGLDFELFKKRYEQIVSAGNIRCVIMATYNIFSISSIEQLFEWVYDLKVRYNPDNSIKKIEHDTGFELSPYSLIERSEVNKDHAMIVGIDIPYLRHPECLDVQYASHDLVQDYMIPSLHYMSANLGNNDWRNHLGFESYEQDKFRRIVLHRMYFDKPAKPETHDTAKILPQRAKFYDFVNEIDKMNGTNFLEVFPEYETFYNICKESKERLLNDDTLKGII